MNSLTKIIQSIKVYNPSAIQLPGEKCPGEFPEFQDEIIAFFAEYGGKWNSKNSTFAFAGMAQFKSIDLLRIDMIKKANLMEPKETEVEKRNNALLENADKRQQYFMLAQDMVNALRYDNDVNDAKNWVLNPYPANGTIIDAFHEQNPAARVAFCQPDEKIKTGEQLVNESIGNISDLNFPNFFDLKTKEMGGKPGQAIPPRKFIIMSAPASVVTPSIVHAYYLLAEGGRLVALIGEDFLDNDIDLLNFLDDVEYFKEIQPDNEIAKKNNLFILIIDK